MSIQLGAHIGQQNLAMDEMRALWRRLDEAGLDWISVWDHLYEVPPQGGTQPHFEGLTTAAVLCGDTSNARVAVMVCCVLYRNPAYLAKAATTLDHISGGRFELGLGAGWAEDEARAFGYDFPAVGTRMDMLEDALPLVKSLLSQERTTYEGRFYSANDAANLPRPVRGSIPIWVGGQGEKRTPRIASTHADGWNVPYLSPDEFARLSANVDRACDAVGRDQSTLERTVNLGFYLTTDPDQVPVLESNLREAAGERADLFMSGLLLGTPDAAFDRLMRYVEVGAQGINVALRAPIDEDALSAYIDEVVPAVRAATAGN